MQQLYFCQHCWNIYMIIWCLQSFVCPLGYDGSYADLSNCTSFYTCVENTAIFNVNNIFIHIFVSFTIRYSTQSHQVCPNDQVFNPDTGRCDVSTNVPRCQVSSAAGNQIRLHDDTFLFVLLLTFVFVSLKWDCKLYRWWLDSCCKLMPIINLTSYE